MRIGESWRLLQSELTNHVRAPSHLWLMSTSRISPDTAVQVRLVGEFGRCRSDSTETTHAEETLRPHRS